MALNKVEICGVNTSRLPVLTNEEKELLFEKIKKGDKEARELYIKGNLRLVLSVIKRFSGSNENADDLFQIGCIGLMKAIDNFDTTLQVKFSTYAVPMIIGDPKIPAGQQYDPGQPVTAGHGLQSDLCPGKLSEKQSPRTDDYGDCIGNWDGKRGDRLRLGCDPKSDEPVRTGVY